MSNIIPATPAALPVDYNGDALMGFEGLVLNGPPPVQRLVLINGTSQLGKIEGSVFGEFFDEATGQSYKELDVLLVSVSTHRAWLAEYDPNAEQQTIYCRSRNGIRPDQDYVGARVNELGVTADKVSCAACPHAQWEDKHVDCPESYRLIAWMPDGTPRVIDARGTSAGPAKKFAMSFLSRRANLYSVRTKITTTKVSGANTYFVMNFHAQMDKPSTAEERAELVKFYQAYGKRFLEEAAAKDAEEHVAEPYTGGPTIDAQAGPAPQTNLF